MHDEKYVLCCCQSCSGPRGKQAQYFGGFKRSHSCVVIDGFDPLCLFVLSDVCYDNDLWQHKRHNLVAIIKIM